MNYGYMGKWLKVNLSSKEMSDFDFPEDILRKFIGGKGLAVYYLWNYAKELEKKGVDLKEMDALSPDNVLFFSTGPVTGTRSPNSGRHHVMALKSPLTGSIGSGNTGGTWGAKLKFAGYDGIVIEGKSDTPVYLSIIDGKPELHDASEIWGKNTIDTTKWLQSKHERKRAGVSCIGPAGENLVPCAVIMNEIHRAAGRTGLGAIMGSKKLKAIIVDGNAKPQIAKQEEFETKVKEHVEKLKENGVTGEGLPTYGTAVLVNIINQNGLFPTKNWQTGVDKEAENISGETLTEKYLISKHPCWGCVVACGRKTKVELGPYKISFTEGPEYEAIWALGGTTNVNNMGAVIRANHYCDIFGMDPISIGSTIAAAMELNEKGLIPEEDLQGLKVEFGNPDAIVELTWMAAFRQGLGYWIGEGSRKMCEHYGAPELSMSVKGLEMPAYDPRGAKGIGLNYATANRGGCHVTGYTIAAEVLGDVDRFTIEGKAELTKTFQDFTSVVNSSVNCLFLTFALGLDEYAEMIGPVTGWDVTTDELLKTGERITNLERMILNKLGISGKDDTLPKRLLEEKMPEGASEGQIVELEQMKQEYYKLRGWEDGIPTPEKIKELELEI
ncbi:MAG: aldehyde ferredoxin oxidoreductase family protein [Candidatus Heimdallarchaeum aukensis]|uniref:Aldehyde ferredoxin oxidoreductase family protein n=1 Tax=Candidatus Heimdallarchaeum aukensis TaxID=2876573 RepID=A0A9Y1FKR0_9ARCH|nr:MAG: aldehyde ferredoxin oxidoreductase family protein [Candidatus Heimdallarchaeum aukensis]